MFFDTETSGLHAGFDQIVQFAAIRTDNNLNEIDRVELRSRLDPNVVPSIGALKANGFSIEDLIDGRHLTHYQMVREVCARLTSWSPSIFLGYNSIRFDEEFLRHALFKTLHSPYLTSLHGNGRNDIMSLALACHAIGDGSIVVPPKDNGGVSFRLQDLAVANGIEAVRAHDALSDTETALEVCRLVKRRTPDLWQRFVRFSNKASVADFVSSGEPFLLTEFFANEAFHTPVVFVASEPGQPNGMLCMNLSSPVDSITSLTHEQLKAKLSSRPSPIRRIRTNAGPTMMPLWEVADEFFGETSCEELEERAAQISDDEHLGSKIVAAFADTRTEYPEPTHVEEKLYSCFLTRDDEALCRRFHEAPWNERLDIVRRFNDDRLKELGKRLIYFESRSSLPKDVAREMDIGLGERLMSLDGKPLSIVQALKQVETMKLESEESPKSGALVDGYTAYLTERSSKVSRYLGSI